MINLIKCIKLSISFDFIFLLFIFFVFKSFDFLKFFNLYIVHDTAQAIQTFYFFYNEFYINNIIPLWMPYGLYGIPIDYNSLMSISPAQFFMMLSGKLLHIKDSFMLFKLSMVIEELSLFVGVYLLAKRFFQKRETVLFVCIGIIATIFWNMQIWFSFRLYYLIPLWLYFVIKFFDAYDFKYLWISGIIAVVSLIGNVPYFAPLFLFIFVTFVVFLFVTKTNNMTFRIRNIFAPLSLALLSLLIILIFVYVDYARHVFDYLQLYSPGRSYNGKTSVETFLTYGGSIQVRSILEFFYAMPHSKDYSLYIGLIPIVFLIYGFLFKKNNSFFIVLIAVSFMLILFSFGSVGGVAPVLYYIFPGMSYFRHIGYVKVITKILLLIASGFGLDHYLASYKYDEQTSKSIKKSAPFYIGVGLLILIVIINLLVIILKLTTHKIVYPFDNGIPYYYHVVAVFLLLMFIYLLSKQFFNKKIIPNAIISLYFIEITLYCLGMSYFQPVKYPDCKLINSLEIAEDCSKDGLYTSVFNAREYPYRNERISNDEMYKIRPEMPIILQSYLTGKFTTYFNVYSAFYVDSCLQEYRTDYMTQGFDYLMRARLDIPFNKPLANVMSGKQSLAEVDFMRTISKDEDLMKAIGCNTSKIRFVSNPVIVNNLDTAAKMIKESSSLNKKPVILESSSTEDVMSFYKKNLSGSNKYIKFDVTKFTANMIEIITDVGFYDNIWLIYLDNYHPGWKATVNGKPAFITQANIAFKAVKLDKGHNIVRFVFENLRTKIYITIFFIVGTVGALILMISVIFLSVPCFYEYIKRKRCLLWKQ